MGWFSSNNSYESVYTEGELRDYIYDLKYELQQVEELHLNEIHSLCGDVEFYIPVIEDLKDRIRDLEIELFRMCY